ncbi:hypothetical protein CR513_02287, partial [Mucuna pruriens]
MTHAMPWYVYICNYLVASTYPKGASKAVKEKLENDAKYYICEDPYMFGMLKVLISDQGSHFYNRAMAMLLNKYGMMHRVSIA